MTKNTYVKYYLEFAEENNLSPIAALLYFFIEFFSRGNGSCTYSKKSLAKFLHTSEPTVYKILRELARKDLVRFGKMTNMNTRELIPTEKGVLFIEEMNKEFNEPKNKRR